MLKKKPVVVFAGLLFLFSLASFAAGTDLYNLNRRPFVKGGAENEQNLRELLLKNADDLKAGFERAGMVELFEPFMTQLAEAEIAIEVIPAFDRKSGEDPMHVQWMLFRSSNGSIKVLEDVNWKVRRDEKVFRLTVKHNCRDYHFLVPDRCVNVSLMAHSASRAVCVINVSPDKVDFGEPFAIDMSNSICVDVLKVKVFDADGKVVKEGEIKASDPTMTITLDESGDFTIEAVPYNVEGVEGDACTAKVHVNFPPIPEPVEPVVEAEKRFYGVLEAGPMVVRGTYSGYLFARFGFMYKIVPDSLDLVVSAGPALTLTGAPFKSFLMGNVLLNYNINKFFLGGGLAYTTQVKDFEYDERPDWNAGLNLVLQAGHEIMRWLNSRSSIFVEFQMPMHDSLNVSKYHMFLLGFRYNF